MHHSVNEFQNSSMARTSPRKVLPMVIVVIGLVSACMYLIIRAI